MTHGLMVIGDALLDRDVIGDVERLCPDAPVPVLDERATLVRPGGAGLAALLAVGDGRQVTLVTALGHDDGGREVAAALRQRGVDVVDLGLRGATPEKVRLTTDGRPLVRLDRGGHGGAVGALTAAARAKIGWADAVLVSDYGRGLAAETGVRAAIAEIADCVPVVWDPHPRGPEPVPGCVLATPNAAEAAGFEPEPPGGDVEALAARAAALARRWRAAHVCITCGDRGVVLGGSEPLVVPAQPAPEGDPCGAGDRFATAAAGLLADGGDVSDAVRAAVARATAFVADGEGPRAFQPATRSAWRAGTDGVAADAVTARVRAAGGTVVATGGCFDLLHAGHVRTLEAARALGDCLVVCLNSDASVRRLKGPRRPIVGQEQRAAVLLALSCVDAVAIFDDNTPEGLLERLCPDVWAKGGDYTADELPERAVMERHGGCAVVLPYLPGRSTTRLIEEVGAHAAV